MLWKVYYQDQTFTSDDGDWTDVPPRGIQAVAIPHPTAYRQILTGDFYWWSPWANGPVQSDWTGVVDFLLEQGVMTPNQKFTDISPAIQWEQGVRWGRSLSDIEYNRVYQQIVEDADLVVWGQKVGRLPSERRVR